MAYGAAVAMILLALMPSGAGIPSLLRNWFSTVALLVWTCGLIMALLTVFRRVDAARAAVGFISIRRRAARVVGRKWGRYQALAIELDSHIDSCVATEMAPEPVPNVWDRPIASQRRGILLPSRSALRRLFMDEAVKHGLRLRFSKPLCVAVNRHDVVASTKVVYESGREVRTGVS